jgi:excisionase family DNA binding protein
VATFLTPREVGERWHCSPRHVRRLAERHQLPGLRVGGAWRFSLDSVEAYEAGHTTACESAPTTAPAPKEVQLATGAAGFTLPADYEPVFKDLWLTAEPNEKAAVSG